MADEEKKEEVGGAAAAPEAPGSSTELTATDGGGGGETRRVLQKEMVMEEGQKAGDKFMLSVPWGGEVEVVVPEGKAVGESYMVEVDVPDGVTPPEGSGGPRMFNTQVTIPDDAKAGDSLKVRLPWGQVIDVEAPEGLKSGDTFGIKVPVPPGVQGNPGGEPQKATIECQVPEGLEEGSTFKITLPWGQEIEISCPPEHKGGDKFKIEVPIPPEVAAQQGYGPPQTVTKTVTVPPGLTEGQTFPLTTPWGQELSVKVPEGLKEGDEFNIKVPARQPPRMVDVSVEIPEGCGAAEGLQKSFSAKLPWGQSVTVAVPDGGKAGDKFKIEVPLPPGAPPPRRVLEEEITVPEGHDVATPMTVTLPWGATIDVTPPEGSKAGDKFKIEVPVPPHVGDPQVFNSEITIPDEAEPGSLLKVTLPWGAVLDVTVPEGAAPGSIIRIQVPVPPGAQEMMRKQEAAAAKKKRRNKKKKKGKK